MSPEAQRIALSKWGKKHGIEHVFMDEDGCEQNGLLDTNDLNVIREMEEKLDDAQKAEYTTLLSGIAYDGTDHSRWLVPAPRWFLLHASSPQRCEALCRTLGLWKD